jgi:hypothetical protein
MPPAARRPRCIQRPRTGSGGSWRRCGARGPCASASRRGSPRISVMPAACMATSVPPPIAMPTSAAASAGASLMPSPTIATASRRPHVRATIEALSCGSTSACTSSMPSALATGAPRPALSPDSMTVRTALCACRRPRPRALALTRVAERQHADQHRRVRHVGQPGDRAAFRLRLRSPAASSAAGRTPSSAIQRALPRRSSRPSTRPAHAAAGDRMDALGRRRVDGAVTCRDEHGARERVFAAGLQRGGQRSSPPRSPSALPARRPAAACLR